MDNDDPAAQEARVKKLWQVLDTKKDGQVSLNGLKNGLRKMDHRTRCTLAMETPCLLWISSQKRRLAS